MDLYIVIVVILLLLAAIDLTVGVANDAVNFLNSALGAKAGSFKLLLTIAAVGVFIGVLFSSGMMEVARKGIFHPQFFVMRELLIIFVAVMFQDILLLDVFNSLGLPTSTTVSLVFGLFGSAVAMSIIKIIDANDSFSLISQYINLESVFTIASAIFLSIIFAFIFGSAIQYISRLIFTFDYEKRFKKYGGLWSGAALTALSIFILVKGAKGASFIDDATALWIKENIWTLVVYLFIAWSVILQLFISFTKFNVLKFIVWFGTFALAMAFAANDLVNFIGAPLAGLSAYQIGQNFADPANAAMDALQNPVKANTYLLLIAGTIMVVTLFVSRKARNVAKTTINLGRQNEGIEKFESNLVARAIVRIVSGFIASIVKITPAKIRENIKERFDTKKFEPLIDENGAPQAFDLIRAAVILMVSAGLISVATSMKLPLSTTYVTFIVAMAAALPDNAWGRESAVYRVSGVITVVAGWFLTAFIASIFAGLLAAFIYYTEYFGLFVLLGVTGFEIYHSRKTSRKKEDAETKEVMKIKKELESPVYMFENALVEVNDFISEITKITEKSIKSIIKFKLNSAYKSNKKSQKLNIQSELIIRKFLKLVKFTPEKEIKKGDSFTSILINFQEAVDSLNNITKSIFNYIDNFLNELTEEQKDDLKSVLGHFNNHSDNIAQAIKLKDFSNMDKLKSECAVMNKQIEFYATQQLIRIKEQATNYKRSLLYLNLLNDIKQLISDLYQIGLTCREIEIFMNNELRENKVDLNNPTKTIN